MYLIQLNYGFTCDIRGMDENENQSTGWYQGGVEGAAALLPLHTFTLLLISTYVVNPTDYISMSVQVVVYPGAGLHVGLHTHGQITDRGYRARPLSLSLTSWTKKRRQDPTFPRGTRDC